MKIGTKCSFNKEQLLCSLSKGLKSLEFHTNYSDFEGDIDLSEIKNILKENNVSCHAIHTPISDKYGVKESISIGTFFKQQRNENIILFKKCIDAANYLCEDTTPIVVAHIGTGYNVQNNDLNKLNREQIEIILSDAKEDLEIINNYILSNYPNTLFVVENMPSMTYSNNEELHSWYFGFNEDLPKFIKSLNLSNIKTCLDICHLTTTMRINKLVNPYFSKSLDYYIKEYSDTLGLIHLNNCINLGEKIEWHSASFDKNNIDDVDLLLQFFKSMLKNNVNCPISLEINEKDYLKQENTSKTIECIDYVLEKLSITDREKITFKK